LQQKEKSCNQTISKLQQKKGVATKPPKIATKRENLQRNPVKLQQKEKSCNQIPQGTPHIKRSFPFLLGNFSSF
jgi:hypothetical protein